MLLGPPEDKKIVMTSRADSLSSNSHIFPIDFSDIYTAFIPSNARTRDPECDNRASVFRKRKFKNNMTPELRPASIIMSSSDDEKENSIIPNTPSKRIRTRGCFISHK